MVTGFPACPMLLESKVFKSLRQQMYAVAALVLIRRCYDQEIIQVVNDKFHPLLSYHPLCASARAVNILGADCRMNGRAMSTNSEPSHIIPIIHLSSG